jgi:hypothetical protein
MSASAAASPPHKKYQTFTVKINTAQYIRSIEFSPATPLDVIKETLLIRLLDPIAGVQMLRGIAVNIDQLSIYANEDDQKDNNPIQGILENQAENYIAVLILSVEQETQIFGVTQKIVNRDSEESIDISSRLYEVLTRKFDLEPSEEELFSILSIDPLEKIPLHPHNYNRLAKIIPEYCMKKLFRASSNESCDLDANLMNLALMKVKLDEEYGEQTLHFYLDSLIKEVLQKLLYFSNLSIYSSRNVKDASNTTEPSLRPDFLFYVNQFLILRGEEKKKRGELNVAKNELIDKLRKWSVHTFGYLNYIFGYACAGEALTFCSIFRTGKISDISRIYDLESVVDRFEIVICVINLARLFKTVAHRIPSGSVMLYRPIHRLNGCIIEIRDDYIMKKIPFTLQEYREKFDYLETIYRLLSVQSVPHVPELLEIKESLKKRGDIRYIELKLRPCGLEIIPQSLQLLLFALNSVILALESIHKLGYVHRDIRWPNIIYVSDKDWRLIDFENSSLANDQLIADDMRMFGQLLLRFEFAAFVANDFFVSLREFLASDPPPSASEACIRIRSFFTK